MANENFPLTYGSVHLFDELKHLALRQELDAAQMAIPQNCNKALKISGEIQKVLQQATIKRDALFTKESVNDSFGIESNLRKAGIESNKLKNIKTK
ncbi:MAG: hypothetical protein ABI761_05815 [Saprospiraceae bacterium]